MLPVTPPATPADPSLDVESPDAVPYFNWDAPVTNAEIRRALADGSEDDKLFWTARILSEARYAVAMAGALAKDGGADPATLAWVVGQIRIGPAAVLPGGISGDELESFRIELELRLRRMAFPGEQWMTAPTFRAGAGHPSTAARPCSQPSPARSISDA